MEPSDSEIWLSSLKEVQGVQGRKRDQREQQVWINGSRVVQHGGCGDQSEQLR